MKFINLCLLSVQIIDSLESWRQHSNMRRIFVFTKLRSILHTQFGTFRGVQSTIRYRMLTFSRFYVHFTIYFLLAKLSWSPVVHHPSVYLSVRPSACSSVCKLFTFSSSSQEPLGRFQPNLTQNILGWRGFKFVQMKDHALFQGEIIRKYQNTLTNLKSFLFKNHWATFNQTWHKASLGDRDSNVSKWRVMPFFKGR